MSFDTLLEGASLRCAEFMASPPVVAEVPRFVTAVGAAPRGASVPEQRAHARLEVGAGRWIKCHDRWGVVEMHDPRLFRPGREAFCGELLKVAIEQHQAVCGEVCLTDSLCRLQFERGRFTQWELADRVAAALRAATPAIRDGSGASQKRQRTWTTLTAFATEAGASVWETREDRPGQLILTDRAPAPAQGSSRVLDLALAGGSFVLAVTGAILPGIPALPFLALAGHYVIRVSPGLHRFLRRQPWCAPLLDKAEGSARLPRLTGRSLLKAVGVMALVAAAFLILHPPLPIVLAIELGLMAFFYLRELDLPSLCNGGLAAWA